jgi:hypothetical protein
MAKVNPKLPPVLKALVQERLQPNEFVLWYSRLNQGEVTVHLIDRELHRMCAPIAKKFGGKGSGCGRTLQFKLENGSWSFAGEGGWIS